MRQSKKQNNFGLILGLAVFLVSCYKLGLNDGQNAEFSSQIPTVQSSSEFLVTYPSYSRVVNQDQSEQSELLVNPQSDGATCEIVELTGPISSSNEMNVCETLPDLCWTNKVATVNKASDLTCAQAFRASDLLFSRSQAPCSPTTESLSSSEKNEINNPSFYRTNNELSMLNVQMASVSTLVPQLDSISLEASCRCNYSSTNESTGKYKFPALEEHCSSHFSDIYR